MKSNKKKGTIFFSFNYVIYKIQIACEYIFGIHTNYKDYVACPLYV